MSYIDIGLPPVDAEAMLDIAPDGLQASIRIKAPENGGADIAYGALRVFLAKNRVIYGLDEQFLQQLCANPVYNESFVIARGTPREDGTDAELVFHIERDRQLKPKERPDGSVDFKDLGAIQEIAKGFLLCEKIPATPGVNGTDVRGISIRATPGKDLFLPEGKNTIVSEDRLKLYAGVDGHVTFIGGKISVLDTFVVDGNVSVETGNIDFAGNVVVRGDVAQGYAVKATGDVTIEGTVEAASLTVGGNLVIRGGFLGGDSGTIQAAGNITCRFIESGRVTLRGNLETTYIMNAEVKCGGAVNLSGKGLIRGGHVASRSSVTASLLGSEKSSSASTVIEVGNDPTLAVSYERASKEAAEHEKNIAGLEAATAKLEAARASGALSKESAQQLDKANLLLASLRPAHQAAKSEMERLEMQLSRLGRGTVNVRRVAHTGLKIVIGQEILILQSDHERVTFYTTKDGITFGPLME